MKQTAESISKMKTLCAKLHDLSDSETLDSITKKWLIYYVTAIQSQLDNLPGYILEER